MPEIKINTTILAEDWEFNEWYTPPSSNNKFLKLDTGKTTLRILTDAVRWWEYFHDDKPFRFKEEKKPSDTKIPEWCKLKYFMEVIIWNYDTRSLQAWHITQASLQKEIMKFVENENWWNPISYRLEITKKWEWLKTTYSVTPLPKSKVEDEILQEFAIREIDLNRIFSNEDPFIT